jgi:hypothetical protein
MLTYRTYRILHEKMVIFHNYFNSFPNNSFDDVDAIPIALSREDIKYIL